MDIGLDAWEKARGDNGKDKLPQTTQARILGWNQTQRESIFWVTPEVELGVITHP